MKTIIRGIILAALLIILQGCSHIQYVNSDSHMHEITRYSDSGRIIEQYIYASRTPSLIDKALISFTVVDTTYYLSDNITIKQWKK